MITKVVHGRQVGGLIAYLLGPGRAEEHRRPRVIASWDGRDTGWQPRSAGPGEWDLELGPLIRALRAPAVAAGLSEHRDELGRRGFVWHCSARLAAADRTLSDAEWAQVARELLHGAGVAARDDLGGPRWVAIRHAEDHIHIAVVLVRQDSGRRFWPFRDFPRLRETARELEARWGLTLTAGPDGTAERAPSRGEREKAARQGRMPARVELARVVRRAAVAATDVASFVDYLRGKGVVVKVRVGPSGDPLGYAVGRGGEVSRGGEQILYSGSKLAADLSLPRLQRRWAGMSGGTAESGEPLVVARFAADRVRRALGTASEEAAADLAAAAADLVVACSGWRLGGVGLDAAAGPFDRATRPERGVRARSSPESVALRRVAHRVLRRGPLAGGDAGGDEVAAAVALTVALAALMREVMAWQDRRGCIHQVRAAAVAVDVVDTWSRQWRPRPPARPVNAGVDPVGTTDRPRRVPPPPRRWPGPRG